MVVIQFMVIIQCIENNKTEIIKNVVKWKN